MRKLVLMLFLLLTLPSFAGEGGQQIRFAAGADYGTVAGSIIRGEVADYRLGAGKGQRMTIAISSVEDNAEFDIYGPNGLMVRAAKAWSGSLPANYSYRVRVASSRGNASYRMIVHIR